MFESTDGGSDWAPLNAGCAADFCPNPNPSSATTRTACGCTRPQPDRLYQQNHCGIYRIDRPDGRWVRIGDNMPTEVGDIGFPIELHPRDPDTAWVFPMDGTDVWPRTSPDGSPAAYVTRDGGATWSRLDEGLPERGVVHGEAPGDDRRRRRPDVGIYFGTTCGEVWASTDEGDEWHQLAAHLPEIYSRRGR